jgi:DNA-binding response OmpR family regulator
MADETTRRAKMGTGPPPLLLLVEDDDSVRDLLSEVLEGAGFTVNTARTASEAVEQLTSRRYAVIATDCVLPDLSPLEWLAAARGTAPGTPLVLYSGTVALDELQQLATDWRAAAVLEKPFKPAELVAAVRNAIGRPGHSACI